MGPMASPPSPAPALALPTAAAAAPSEPSPAPGHFDLLPSTSRLHTIKTEGSKPKEPQLEEQPVEEEPISQDAEADPASSEDESDTDSPTPSPPVEPELAEVAVPAVDPPESSQEEEEGSESDEDETDDDGEAEEAEASASEDEDDENDEDEPTLKYARLEGATTDILAKDSASALAVSPKYIVRRRPTSTSWPASPGLEWRNAHVFIIRHSGRTTVRSSSSTFWAPSSNASARTKPWSTTSASTSGATLSPAPLWMVTSFSVSDSWP